MMPTFFFLLNFDVQFPIGIDSNRFIRALELPQVQDHIHELKERFAGRKVTIIFPCVEVQMLAAFVLLKVSCFCLLQVFVM